MEELLKKLGINKKGSFISSVYSINFTSYDEFSAIYNTLEQSNDIIKNSDESTFNMDEAHVVYNTDDYEINLNGDLIDDVYKLQIKEK